jgi:hypothetical protein
LLVVHPIVNKATTDMDIVPDVGHFELESPSYDPIVAEKVIRWLGEVLR